MTQIYMTFSPGTLTSEQLQTLLSELKNEQAHINLSQRKSAVVASGLLERLVEFFLENPIASAAVYDILKLAVKKSIALIKDKQPKLMKMDGKQLVEVSYPIFYTPIQIKTGNAYNQYFYICIDLPYEIVADGLDEIKIVSERRLTKWNKLDDKPNYLEENFRLTKKGKWKKIKNFNKMSAKMKAVSIRKVLYRSSPEEEV